MKITSPEFKQNQPIPTRFTCKGEDINPELVISEIPPKTVSLALIVDDPDAPGKTWVHWVVYNIAPTTTIAQNSAPGQQGWNDFKRVGYGGPCPPSGTHRYYFKLYALDTELKLDQPTKKQLLEAMEGHVIEQAQTMGTFSI